MREKEIVPASFFPGSVIAIISIFFFVNPCRRSTSASTRTRGGVAAELLILCILGRGLLGDVLAGVDPVRVNVDGGGEVVDSGLEPLSADLAVEIADPGLFVQFDLDGLFVVAKEAGEGRREWFSLHMKRQSTKRFPSTSTPRGKEGVNSF